MWGTNAAAVLAWNPGNSEIILSFSSCVSLLHKISGYLVKITFIFLAPNPLPNIFVPAIRASRLTFRILLRILLYILFDNFSLKPSTVKKSSTLIDTIFGIVSNPASIIRCILPLPNPTTPIFSKNAAILFINTILLLALSFNTRSILVLFQTVSILEGGALPCSEGAITLWTLGITSPLLISCITLPTLILLLNMNAALWPVAYSILAPPISTGLILILGFT